MKRKTVSKVLIGLLAFIGLFLITLNFFIEPWLKDKITTAVNEKSDDYRIVIKRIDISVLRPGIELKSISIQSKQTTESEDALNIQVDFIKVKGINVWKLIANKDIAVKALIISKSNINGVLPPASKKEKKATILPLNIKIDRILLDTINVDVRHDSTAQAYAIKKAVINVNDLQFSKDDTLSADVIKNFNLKAETIRMVSADSMYTYNIDTLNFSDTLNKLEIAAFSIAPNYGNYEFTSQYPHEIDRFEASLAKINIHDFHPSDYIASKNIGSSFIEIDKMDLTIFRDKRKAETQNEKTEFQDLIYNYAGDINIDSIGVKQGNVTYIEHAEKAEEPGRISFNDIAAKLYKISNLPKYKTTNDSLSLIATAFLMGKGKVDFNLQVKLYDPRNTFKLTGSVSEMQGSDLNPIVSKNAFVYINSGIINKMDFTFTANSTESNGDMRLLYQDLDVTVKDKKSNDTTGLKEKIISLFANIIIIESNPEKNEAIRIGDIHYKRNPKKSFFNYVSKSIITGVKSTAIED